MKRTVQTDTPALVLDNVYKYYSQWQRTGKLSDTLKNLFKPQKRKLTALDGVSLRVEKGDFVAYAGANGAGKSTTIKILCGILQPSDGEVSVLGLNPAKDRITLMRRIGIVFGQRTELWWDHPVITSYEWKKVVWGIPDEVYNKNLQEVTELLDLSDILHTFSRELSLGQRMRADLGMMLLHDPEVVFLDEPTLGLDVLAKQQMITFLRRINAEQGTTVIVTSHDMDDLEAMARRIVLLSHGKVAFDGSFEALRTVQGSLGRIRVTARSDMPPNFSSLAFLSSQGNVHEYAYDSDGTPIQEILTQLSGSEDVQNVEILKVPIEDIIASLYKSWKQQEPNQCITQKSL